jgi:hypothetical protein
MEFGSEPYNLIVSFVIGVKVAPHTGKAIRLVRSQVGLAGKDIMATVAMEAE